MSACFQSGMEFTNPAPAGNEQVQILQQQQPQQQATDTVQNQDFALLSGQDINMGQQLLQQQNNAVAAAAIQNAVLSDVELQSALAQQGFHVELGTNQV